jgi:methionyl aminopeptidase
MKVETHSVAETLRMAQCSRTLFSLFQQLPRQITLGTRGLDIDRRVSRFLRRQGMDSALLGYRGYSHSCSVCPNSLVVHGIPDSRSVAPGDIFTIDIAGRSGNWTTDTAWTYITADARTEVRDLWLQSWQAFRELLCSIHKGISLEEIAVVAEVGATARGLSIFPQFVGHGLGKQLHEPPVVPFHREAFSRTNKEFRLPVDIVLNIEPVYSFGSTEVTLDTDGWSYHTKDGCATSHFELTLLMRESGTEILQFGGISPRELPLIPPFGELLS